MEQRSIQYVNAKPPVSFGDNKIPSGVSEADLETLGPCYCGCERFEKICVESGFGVERCTNCEVLRTNPRLIQSAIQRCYAEASKGLTFPLISTEVQHLPGKRSYPWRRVALRYRELASRCMRKFVPHGGKPDLLEIGSGDGVFAEKLSEVGFNVHCFDISSIGVENLRKKGLAATFNTSLAEAKFPDNSFDMIVMWEVLEHIPDPPEFAKEVHRLLKPGGYWFIQVPNWRWLELKVRMVSTVFQGRPPSFMSKYGVVAPLIHLYHYTHESMKYLLQSVGFKHDESFQIRLFDETSWQPLLGHELQYFLSFVPAFVTKGKIHWNVVLTEFYRRP